MKGEEKKKRFKYLAYLCESMEATPSKEHLQSVLIYINSNIEDLQKRMIELQNQLATFNLLKKKVEKDLK